MGDFQTPECIEHMGPRKVVKREDRLLQVIREEVWNDKQRSLPIERARADSRAQILKEPGLFEGGPLQDKLINDDTQKKILSGLAQSVAKQTTTKVEKPNYNMSRDYESYYISFRLNRM